MSGSGSGSGVAEPPVEQGAPPPGRPAPRRGRWVVLAILAIFAGAIFASISEIATQEPAEQDLVALEGVRDAQRLFGGARQFGDRIGDPGAPVTIQFFTDIQCEACAEQYFETVPPIMEDLVRDGQVQILFRHYSFARNPVQEGMIAAEAAAEQGYLWQYIHIFFASQPEAERLGIDSDYLEAIAASIPELNLEQWRLDYGEGRQVLLDRLAEQDQLALGLELRAEPSAIINGPGGTETLQDTPDLEQIREAVAEVS